MKLNWKVLKVTLVLVFSLVILYWTFTTLSPSSYTGTSLDFPVGHGIVSINNPSSEAITIQIISTGSRGFRVVRSIGTISGVSTRQGTGRTVTQVFEVIVPQGLHEFSVTSGVNTRLIANSPVVLEATVYGLNEVESQAVIFGAILSIVVLLLYILKLTQDAWMPLVRPQRNSNMLPVPETNESGQGVAVHSYGDNRKVREAKE